MPEQQPSKMDTLKKIVSRGKQRVTEAVMNAEKTEIGADIEQLLAQTDKTEEQMKKLLSAIEAYLVPNPNIRVLDPRKDKSNRKNNTDALGDAMKEAGNALGPDTQYGGVLLLTAQAEAKLGTAERLLTHTISNQTMVGIRRILDVDIKNIQKERSALNKRRLDLDATKNRWKRASTPDAQAKVEPQLVTAQAEFDEQLETVRGLLEAFQPAVDAQLKHMLEFVAAQSQYHTTCQQHLAELKRDLLANR
uniref:BAR domain-containing protein n=1 Tax=Globodera rostochiensis TaxID=31243 RepID=A0A914HE71_GLORO